MSTPTDRLRYRAVVTDRPARGIASAAIVSDVGDYVGLAALLILAFDASGSALGPAAVYAVKALPALLVGTVFSGWLDVPSRKTALVGVSLATAALLATVAAVPQLTVALLAASLLGAVRAVNASVTAGAVAESVAPHARQPTLGLIGATHQSGQVVGFLTGGTLSLLLSPSQALLVNVATALVAAALLAATPLVHGGRPRRETAGSDVRVWAEVTAGVRVLWSHPVLRFVLLGAWATMVASAVPESLAASVSSGGWVAVVLASNAMGGVVGTVLGGRSAALATPKVMRRWIAVGGVGFVATAAALAVGAPVWTVVAGNIVVGAAGGWLIGGQVAVLTHAPADRMAQVNATMIASLIVLEGLGALAVAGVAVAVGAWAAYLTVGVVLLAAVAGLGPLVRRSEA